MPRRSNSMTDLSQMARTSHGDKGDTKPRLSKGEVEILERQFQEQHKPSSNTKRQLAERMGVEISRINVRDDEVIGKRKADKENRIGFKIEGQKQSRRKSKSNLACVKPVLYLTRNLPRRNISIPLVTSTTIFNRQIITWFHFHQEMAAPRRSRRITHTTTTLSLPVGIRSSEP